MSRFAGQVAIVAGAGGIGSATALRLARDGCAVVIGDLLAEAGEAVARQIMQEGGRALAVQFDQSDDGSVGELVEAAACAFGRIDFVHANAADMAVLPSDTDVLTIPLETFDRTLAVNLRGNLVLTRTALPHVLSARGAFVYTSSGAAYVGEDTRLAYAVSKAGLNALVRHVARRWGREGVRANAVCPGLVLSDTVRSRMTDEWHATMTAQTNSWRLGEPEDIAGMVAYLMSREAEWINGQCISVDGGITMRA